MVGLGRRGGNMVERLRRHGHEVVGYARSAPNRDVDSLAGLVAALEGDDPRVVWVMVPAGPATDTVIGELAELLGTGDLVVDGGNTRYTDSLRHRDILGERGIRFVDAGVSGGVWGLEEGYCIMAGGTDADIAVIEPAMRALVTDGGFAHVGDVGAGHYTKMVHNGVEYAMMQAFAEGYELLAAKSADDLPMDIPATLEVWRHGSVVRSWLLDLFADAVQADPDLSSVRGYADDSGEGRWTVQEGVDQAVATPAIAAALYARFVSRQDDSPAMKAIAIMRNAFGGHAIKPGDPT